MFVNLLFKYVKKLVESSFGSDFFYNICVQSTENKYNTQLMFWSDDNTKGILR